jgi:hypothetical protein
VLRQHRARGARTPALIPTSNETVSSRVAVRPFAVDELEARIRVLMRRGQGGAPAPLALGAWSLMRWGGVQRGKGYPTVECHPGFPAGPLLGPPCTCGPA